MNSLFPEIKETTKVCKICGEEKHITEFHKNNTSWNGKTEVNGERYRDQCKECRKSGATKDSASAQEVMNYHNLTRPPLGTPCENPSCGRTDVKLFCDHDHTKDVSDPEVFRGWLCHRCNTALGKFGDNEKGVLGILEYLRRPARVNNQTLYEQE